MPQLVNWPTKGLIVEFVNRIGQAGLSSTPLPAPIPPRGNVVAVGSLSSVLPSLHGANRRFAAVCVDFPHIRTLPTATSFGPVSAVMSIAEQLLEHSAHLVAPGGKLFFLTECWTASWVLSAIDCQTRMHLARVVCWQKRYSALQDKAGSVDSSFDIVFELSAEPVPQVVYELLPDTSGFRSEDATKEEQQLRAEGVYPAGVEPSKRAKPLSLCTELIGRTPPGDVLELLSDSGYFSAAAHAAERQFVSVLDPRPEGADASIERTCARLTTLASVLHVPPVTLDPAPDSRLGRIEFDYEIPRRVRDFGTAVTPFRLESCPTHTVAEVSASDPFFGLRPHLHGASVAALLNVDLQLQIAHLPQLLADWFETAGPTALCAVRAPLCECLRLTSWLQVQYGMEAMKGLIADSTSDHPTWWLVACPSKFTRKFSVSRSPKYSNPTNDPRGAYKDEYKGARSGSESTSRPYNAPPYRFAVTSGNMPPGFCALNPFSGLIYAPAPALIGVYRLTVRVTDATGCPCEQEITIEVHDHNGTASSSDTDVWWLDPPLHVGGSPLRALFPSKISAVVGQPLSVVLRASGGSPFSKVLTPSDRGQDRNDRFWPWGRDTLVSRILEDRIGFGANGDAKFQNRTFQVDRPIKHVSIHSWWSQRTLSNWGFDSSIEALAEVLSPQNGTLVLDGPTPVVGRQSVVVRYKAWPPRVSRIRVRSLPFPMLDSSVDVRDLMVQIGYASVPVAPSLTHLVMWQGVSIDGEQAVLLSPSTSPSTSLLTDLQRSLGVASRLSVYHFCGLPVNKPPIRCVRIPFDVTLV